MCAPPDSRWVFATSTTHFGDLGGVEGADAECQERAAEAGLRGDFFAWISVSDGDAPATRFRRNTGPGEATHFLTGWP